MESYNGSVTAFDIFRNFAVWLSAIPLTFFGDYLLSVQILALFMVLDTITGVARSWKIEGGQSFVSSKLGAGVAGKLLFLLIPCVIGLTGHALKIDLHLVVVWAINIMVLSEAYSIISNVYSYHTGQFVKEFDAVSLICKAALNLVLKLSGNNQEPKL